MPPIIAINVANEPPLRNSRRFRSDKLSSLFMFIGEDERSFRGLSTVHCRSLVCSHYFCAKGYDLPTIFFRPSTPELPDRPETSSRTRAFCEAVCLLQLFDPDVAKTHCAVVALQKDRTRLLDVVVNL